MRRFWLFRSNIKHLEYYHQYKTLEEFEKKCHDFYMLLPIWFLRNGYFDEATVWRLTKKPRKDIVFDVDGKKYFQKWVQNFNETYNYPNPDVSLFRGGFQEYDNATRIYPKKFGLKLYLGTGHRIYTQWNGNYNIYLQEDPADFRANYRCLPFYKTASPHIFHPLDSKNEYKFDICWPCNFAQIRQKGQEDFIRAVSKSKFLKSLKIAHCGNKSVVGKRMCKKYGVDNITFFGELERPKMNELLNDSRLGLCMSNKNDGCPRVATEILMAGTPMILRDQTRLLDYYKKNGVVIVNEKNIAKKIEWALGEHDNLKRQVLYAIKNSISFDAICKKNIVRWQKI